MRESLRKVAKYFKFCEKESNSVERRTKVKSKSFANILQLCSDTVQGRHQELVLFIVSSRRKNSSFAKSMDFPKRQRQHIHWEIHCSILISLLFCSEDFQKLGKDIERGYSPTLGMAKENLMPAKFSENSFGNAIFLPSLIKRVLNERKLEGNLN